MRTRQRRIIPLLVLACLLVSGFSCAGPSGGVSAEFDRQFESIVRPYGFDFTRWEIKTLAGGIKSNLSRSKQESDLSSDTVVRYFETVAEMNTQRHGITRTRLENNSSVLSSEEENLKLLEARAAALKPAVERTIEGQVTRVLKEQGIYNPLNNHWLKLTFPAVKFKLEKPLYLAVVSPRDKIEKVRDRVLRQNLTPAEIEALESSLDSLNVSSLIVQIGGYGAAYPSFVADNSDLRFTLEAVAEEWLHQYLAFKPLGLAYILHLLNITQNAAITTLNETVAGVAAGELAGLVYERYYAQYFPAEDNSGHISPSSGFDFNGTMREIRRQTDLYLAQSQVEAAEKYMQEMRQYLADNGYYLRKLNQAYFAFYGSYAYSPTSIDPVGRKVSSLRLKSASLRDFLDAVSNIKSRQALDRALDAIPQKKSK